MTVPPPTSQPATSRPGSQSRPGGRRSEARGPGAMVVAVLVRPDLWWTALGELRRMAPHLWWRSSPHLPLPDRRLWEFRMVTAYGRPDASPSRADVISFLEWCRAAAASARPRPGGDR